MIITALSEYYDQLCSEHPDEVAEPGWSNISVSYLLILSNDGKLKNIIPASDEKNWTKRLPVHEKRSGRRPKPYLLADKSIYLLGVDAKESPEKAKQRFEDSKKAHIEVFSAAQSDAAHALCKFFETWNPDCALNNECIQRYADKGLLAGSTLSFMFERLDIADDPAIKTAYEQYYWRPSDDDAFVRCLDTGEIEPSPRVQFPIRGVRGGHTTGTSFATFNETAFLSYGRNKNDRDDKKGRNAPISKKGAYKYSAALNYLTNNEMHRIWLGDTTIVYWADHADDKVSSVMSLMMGGYSPNKRQNAEITNRTIDKNIDSIMHTLSQGKLVDTDGFNLFDVTFYVLGLVPNGPRLAVRFFVRDSFGNILENISHHYERLAIVHRDQEPNYLEPYWLLYAAERPREKKNAKKDEPLVITSELIGPLLQSILNDTPYPESLYKDILLRIRASEENKITYARVAFIKAYLIKNVGLYKEGTMETLDNKRDDVAYTLGRLFWTLEDLQHTVSPDINTTINDRYFNAAVATPSRVFPSLLKTAQDHYSKLKRTSPGLANTIDQKIQEETALVETFPKTLSNEAQGDFILGYYHQKNADIQERKQRKLDKEAINA